MSIWSKIGNIFKSIGKILKDAYYEVPKEALSLARKAGLTDEVIGLALAWARVAAKKTLDNAGKREFVVDILVARGIPESVARLATELAVQLLKRKLDA